MLGSKKTKMENVGMITDKKGSFYEWWVQHPYQVPYHHCGDHFI